MIFLSQMENICPGGSPPPELQGGLSVFGLHLPSHPYEPRAQAVKDVATSRWQKVEVVCLEKIVVWLMVLRSVEPYRSCL